MSRADVAGSVRSAFKTPGSAAVLRRQSNDDKDLLTFDTWAIYPSPFLFSGMGRGRGWGRFIAFPIALLKKEDSFGGVAYHRIKTIFLVCEKPCPELVEGPCSVVSL